MLPYILFELIKSDRVGEKAKHMCSWKEKKSQSTKNVTNWRPVQSGWLENICSQRMREGHGKKRRNEEGRR